MQFYSSRRVHSERAPASASNQSFFFSFFIFCWKGGGGSADFWARAGKYHENLNCHSYTTSVNRKQRSGLGRKYVIVRWGVVVPEATCGKLFRSSVLNMAQDIHWPWWGKLRKNVSKCKKKMITHAYLLWKLKIRMWMFQDKLIWRTLKKKTLNSHLQGLLSRPDRFAWLSGSVCFGHRKPSLESSWSTH